MGQKPKLCVGRWFRCSQTALERACDTPGDRILLRRNGLFTPSGKGQIKYRDDKQCKQRAHQHARGYHEADAESDC